MRRVLPLLLAALPVAVALDAAAADPASEGHRLFVQSCGVCHLKPNLKAGLYGPALTRDSVAGKEPAVRELVQTGTPRMPGFRYGLSPVQIDRIVAYLGTVPPAATQPGAKGGQQPVD